MAWQRVTILQTLADAPLPLIPSVWATGALMGIVKFVRNKITLLCRE